MRIRSCALIPVLVFAASACGGDGPTNSEPPSGVLAFTYGGARSGTFQSRGSTVREDGSDIPVAELQEFAVAGRTSNGAATLRMLAGRRSVNATGRFDLLEIDLAQVSRPGTYQFCPVEGGSCARGRMYFDYDLAESTTGIYGLSGGSFVVTEITRDRVRGTFEAQATSLTPATPQTTIQISGGTFDLPLFSADG